MGVELPHVPLGARFHGWGLLPGRPKTVLVGGWGLHSWSRADRVLVYANWFSNSTTHQTNFYADPSASDCRPVRDKAAHLRHAFGLPRLARQLQQDARATRNRF